MKVILLCLNACDMVELSIEGLGIQRQAVDQA